MKNIFFISIAICLLSTGCNKMIDVYPTSNLYDETYYKNVDEVNNALTGCYNGMQKAMYNEWSLTELRSDNSLMGNPTSASSDNRELSDLDMFMPATSHSGVYDYWLKSYYNIYNVNKVMYNLAVNYSPVDGVLSYDSIKIPVTMDDRKRISAEASFIRAYHYFNLVRLYGGVFVIHQPVSPAEAKLINRSDSADIYKLIIADLQNTITNGSQLPFNSINVNDLGRANSWAARALLAKVYLTLNRKADALVLLNDVINNSGYSLLPNYAGVFSTLNEMNAEILFSVRYKSGKVGLGSPFANLFAPNNSGLAVVNGDGQGYNYPTVELAGMYNNLIAGWDFQTTTNGGTAVAVSPNCPSAFTANFGSGNLYLDGTNGSSNWVTSATGNELAGLGGSSTNTTGTNFSTVTSSPAALAFKGGISGVANGKYAVFKFSMTGCQNLSVSYVTRSTSSGFTSQLWEYSTNGTTWFPAETITNIDTNSYKLKTLAIITTLNNAPTAYLRFSGSGATSATGLNRIDNLQFNATNSRGSFNIGQYFGNLYVNKYISNLIYENDGENDWPVIRFADVILMWAEATGNSPQSLDYINQVRTRSGASALSSFDVSTTAKFEKALSDERRLEFAFENQRWFDINRFNTTFTTLTAEQIMKDHFAYMYNLHYIDYPQPMTLQQIQDLVTPQKMKLPIPQREIDNNTIIVIPQNPGY